MLPVNALQIALQSWIAKLDKTFIQSGHYKMILEGLGTTVKITIGALIIGVIIGLVIALIKYLSEDSKALKPLAKLCDLYVTVIRGIPVTVLLLIFYYLIMVTCTDGVLVATITFGINSGAYMAELIRSGINAVDKGQMEAGRCLGLSRLQTMRRIILPQAVRYVLPAVGNEFIALLKETSVAGYVAVVDLTRAGNLVRNNTHDVFNPLMVVAVTYLILVLGLTWLLGKVEKYMAKEKK
jgi:His/Glu/Gln/Arg/opine family amino acid ABC transporter permease subunit